MHAVLGGMGLSLPWLSFFSSYYRPHLGVKVINLALDLNEFRILASTANAVAGMLQGVLKRKIPLPVGIPSPEVTERLVSLRERATALRVEVIGIVHSGKEPELHLV